MGYVVCTNPRAAPATARNFPTSSITRIPRRFLHEQRRDAVIAKGYIDTNNLFVTGGSGGGVLTCWTIEHTDRYRAAAPLYPVINWYSFALTSDIPFITKHWFPLFRGKTPKTTCSVPHQSCQQGQDSISVATGKRLPHLISKPNSFTPRSNS
jgi:acylaminoacyl-peptidase